MNFADRLKKQAEGFLTATRSLWKGLRLEDRYVYKKALKGFRLARTGKHRSTCLTKHEQTRNSPGTKLWVKHCKLEAT